MMFGILPKFKISDNDPLIDDEKLRNMSLMSILTWNHYITEKYECCLKSMGVV